jgi:hypothetical protein
MAETVVRWRRQFRPHTVAMPITYSSYLRLPELLEL